MATVHRSDLKHAWNLLPTNTISWNYFDFAPACQRNGFSLALLSKTTAAVARTPLSLVAHIVNKLYRVSGGSRSITDGIKSQERLHGKNVTLFE